MKNELITEQDNKKMNWWIFHSAWAMQAMWNFERQMNTAFMYGMSKTIDRLYPGEENLEKRKDGYRRHMEFFNITPQCSAFVLGLSIAMEEEYAKDRENFDPASISAIKTSLMGPLSGLGDSLFQGTIRVIAMGIGVQLAQQGSILGPIVAMIISFIPSFLITYYGGKVGYERGRKYITAIAEQNMMERLMYACGIVGLVVVGSMVGGLIDVTTPLAIGESFALQEVLDGIIPGLIPLGLTGIMYYFVKKGAKPLRMMLLTLLMGIILNYFGILA